MSNVPNKVIYSMIGVSKYYDKKPVLKDIYLSYFYGAKIGVIGLNGSGKSSLLRILSGVDQEFQGKTAVSPGFTIGFLEQEPSLDPSKTVLQRVGLDEITPVFAAMGAYETAGIVVIDRFSTGSSSSWSACPDWRKGIASRASPR